MVTTLFAGTIIIHPLLFYLFTLAFLVTFIFKGTLHINLSNPLKLSQLSNFLWLALFLGGLWGLQSLTWGYVWVNDLIEWSLLLIIFYILCRLHLFPNVKLIYYGLFFPLLFVNLVLMIRLNLLQTRHSFLTNLNYLYFVYSAYLLIVFLFFLSLKSLKPTPTSGAYFLIWAPFLAHNPLWITYIFKITTLYSYWVLLLKNSIKIFKNKMISHFFLINFFLIWGVLYAFFFLNYESICNLHLWDLIVFYKSMLTVTPVYTAPGVAVLIEFIDFFFGYFVTSALVIADGLAQVIAFNNFLIIVLLLISFIVKLVEFRSLYKKKAYI